MSCLHYKFNSSLDYDTLTFDGLHISVKDLKRIIFEKNKIGKSTDFDLEITNAQTKEVYTDENSLIPRNASVTVARKPVAAALQKKIPKVWDTKNAGIVSRLPKQSADEGTSVRKLSTDGNKMDETEKLSRMIEESTKDYAPANYQRTSRIQGPPPASYRCKKCNSNEHWVNNCPQANLKRAIGIPREQLVLTTADDPNALLTRSGQYVAQIMHKDAYAQGKKEKHPFYEPLVDLEAPTIDDAFTRSSEQTVDVPKELQCPLCGQLMNDAVLTPCCGVSFCDECVRDRLLEFDHQCPKCGKEVSPDALIQNMNVRQAVQNFQNELSYMQRAGKRHLGAINSDLGTSSRNSSPAVVVIDDNDDETHLLPKPAVQSSNTAVLTVTGKASPETFGDATTATATTTSGSSLESQPFSFEGSRLAVTQDNSQGSSTTQTNQLAAQPAPSYLPPPPGTVPLAPTANAFPQTLGPPSYFTPPQQMGMLPQIAAQPPPPGLGPSPMYYPPIVPPAPFMPPMGAPAFLAGPRLPPPPMSQAEFEHYKRRLQNDVSGGRGDPMASFQRFLDRPRPHKRRDRSSSRSSRSDSSGSRRRSRSRSSSRSPRHSSRRARDSRRRRHSPRSRSRSHHRRSGRDRSHTYSRSRSRTPRRRSRSPRERWSPSNAFHRGPRMHPLDKQPPPQFLYGPTFAAVPTVPMGIFDPTPNFLTVRTHAHDGAPVMEPPRQPAITHDRRPQRSRSRDRDVTVTKPVSESSSSRPKKEDKSKSSSTKKPSGSSRSSGSSRPKDATSPTKTSDKDKAAKNAVEKAKKVLKRKSSAKEDKDKTTPGVIATGEPKSDNPNKAPKDTSSSSSTKNEDAKSQQKVKSERTKTVDDVIDKGAKPRPVEKSVQPLKKSEERKKSGSVEAKTAPVLEKSKPEEVVQKDRTESKEHKQSETSKVRPIATVGPFGKHSASDALLTVANVKENAAAATSVALQTHRKTSAPAAPSSTVTITTATSTTITRTVSVAAKDTSPRKRVLSDKELPQTDEKGHHTKRLVSVSDANNTVVKLEFSGSGTHDSKRRKVSVVSTPNAPSPRATDHTMKRLSNDDRRRSGAEKSDADKTKKKHRHGSRHTSSHDETTTADSEDEKPSSSSKTASKPDSMQKSASSERSGKDLTLSNVVQAMVAPPGGNGTSADSDKKGKKRKAPKAEKHKKHHKKEKDKDGAVRKEKHRHKKKKRRASAKE